MLFPSKRKAIKFEECRLNQARILAPIFPRLLSSSIFNLFAEINAISIPEKKAEAMMLNIIINRILINS